MEDSTISMEDSTISMEDQVDRCPPASPETTACKSTHLVPSVDAPWPYIVKTLITNAIFICATATMAFGQHVSHLNGPDWVQVTEQAPLAAARFTRRDRSQPAIVDSRRMVSVVRSTSARRLDLSRRCTLETGYEKSALEAQRPFDVTGIPRKDVVHGRLV